MGYLSNAQVKRIWVLYNELNHPTYTALAKVTGHTPATISKYIGLCYQALEAQKQEKASVANAVEAVVNSDMATKEDLDLAVDTLVRELRRRSK